MSSEDLKEFKITVKADGKIELKDSHIRPCELKLDPLKKRTIETLIDMLREGRLIRRREYQTLGANLYSVLLDNPIGDDLISKVTDRASKRVFRINLEFETDSGCKGHIAYGMECWPWEYLCHEPRIAQPGLRSYLATSTKLTLTRSLWLSVESSDTVLAEAPLRVLFVVAMPYDLAEFNYEATQSAVKMFIDDVKVRLAARFAESSSENGSSADKPASLVLFNFLIDPDPKLAKDRSAGYQAMATWDNFRAHVMSLNPNVIHFLGHGSYEADVGRIAFTHSNGQAHWIDDALIAGTLDAMNTDLKLVFLQACESGSPPKDSHDPYRGVSGVGLCLAKCNIPAVVAMQYNIENGDADIFAEAFYKALAENKPIDMAVQNGRYSIAASTGEAFGLPVLYSRKPGALIPDRPAGQAPSGYSSNPVTAPVSEETKKEADSPFYNAAKVP